jgi:lipoprotein-releasing system ATP-binding protein
MNLELDAVSKAFETGRRTVPVLDEVSFALEPGAAVAVTGPSGAGKSTLLHVIGTLEPPDSGTVRIGGRDPFAMSEPETARFRNESIGFVFQDHHLLPQYTVLENALIPTLAFAGGSDGEARARELLDRVGLSHRLDHVPSELSGGERQRVAIARALINRPALLLCDEPTGNLDTRTADAVASLLTELHREENNILLVVTHSLELADRFERRFELRDGRCSER